MNQQNQQPAHCSWSPDFKADPNFKEFVPSDYYLVHKDELAELRKDKARLDWLVSDDGPLFDNDGRIDWKWQAGSSTLFGMSLRTAIDAAMKEKK